MFKKKTLCHTSVTVVLTICRLTVGAPRLVVENEHLQDVSVTSIVAWGGGERARCLMSLLMCDEVCAALFNCKTFLSWPFWR